MDAAALRYWIGFNRINGIGAARFNSLIKYFNADLAAAWHAPEREMLNAIADRRACDSFVKARQTADLDADLAALTPFDARAITLLDDEYPALLRQIDSPPPLLYIRGRLTEADSRAFSIVGTRSPTAYGLQAAQELTAALVTSGLTIVSGLAKGIDSAAHRTALGNGGRTIAFLGHGIDRVYPATNGALAAEIVKNGALITEFPLGTPPDGGNFPMRNRLISGISLGVLVVEATAHSGALGTARAALDQGREVFAVPGSIYSAESQGTHLLIQSGEAKLIYRADDILAELTVGGKKGSLAATVAPDQAVIPAPARARRKITAPDPPPDSMSIEPALRFPSDVPVDLSEPEALLLQSLTATPKYIDELAAETGLPIGQVTATLTLLDMRGLIRAVGVKSYTR